MDGLSKGAQRGLPINNINSSYTKPTLVLTLIAARRDQIYL